MGAEPWSAFTAYKVNLEEALCTLQAEVFRRGEYNKPYADISFLDALAFFEISDQEREEMFVQYGLAPLREPIRQVGIEGLLQWLEAHNTAEVLNTREELEALNCLSTDGTASVLDMHGITDQPTSGNVSPLPACELLRMFGTERPTHDMVEKNTDYYDNLARGHGIYIVVYDHDQPSELFFAGYSYD